MRIEHHIKDFSKLLDEGAVNGLTPKQIKAHIGLYEGYVKKLNEIEQLLDAMRSKMPAEPDILQRNANFSYGSYSELKRRETVAYNGSYLHKAYFENLEPVAEPDDQMRKLINESFGSIELWQAETKADAASTPGWVLVTYDHVRQRLHNWVINEHSINVPAMAQDLVLALDCWEHAYAIDYGTDKASYVKVFIENINWQEANERLNEILNRRRSPESK